MVKVSVIIPTFNCAPYLGYAIDSVLSQTMSSFELIIVDDGSDDNTEEIVAAYLGDDRIRFIRQANRKLPGARNAGVSGASGEYLAFLDADDALAPAALEILSKALDHDVHLGWCVTDILRITVTGREIVRSIIPTSNLHHAILKNDFIRRGMFFRRTCFLAIGGYDEKIEVREDWDLNIRMIAAGLEFSYVPLPLYEYAMREGSITTADPGRKLAFTGQVLRKHHKRLADAGDCRVTSIYAELMWDLARRYFYDTGSLLRSLPCIVESIRYDRHLYRLWHGIAYGIHKLRF